MKDKNNFHPFAALTILFWSVAYVLTRLTLRWFSAFSLGFLRYFAAACALAVIVLAAKIKPPGKADFKWVALSGFFGFFLYMIAFNQGCRTVSAATASVIIATVPVFTALLARCFYGEKLRAYQWAAIVVEFCGVVLLTMLDGAVSLNAGVLWLLLAAASLGVYNLLQRRLTKTYSSLQSASYSIFAGAAMLCVFAPQAAQEAAGAPPVQFVYIAVLGVFSSAFAYIAWAEAFKRAKQTSSVSNYMFVTPFLTALLGFALMGESPDLATTAGGAVILAGMVLFNFGSRIRRKARKEKGSGI
jgi:drug/metabolite transporter (DMT)-like permease